ncbi:MAG: ParA family protein [Candidatus Omnitrophica bacterium]|nr:ParA family protein [Candidatus Omnitrophota bacterium]
MAKIVAFCNQKGGVGKTTSVINLGTYIALSGKRVLLVDFDPQGNTTSGLGIDKTSLISSIYDLISGNVQPGEATLSTCVDNLRLIPSSLNLTGAEIELVAELDRERYLKRSLEPFISDYDFIFIDSPPSLGLLTINVLCAADSVIIPIQCEYYALEGLSQLINTINLVRDRLNSHLKIEGVLLTMADFRTNLTDEVIQEARTFFKERVYDTIIPRSIRLSEAPGFGKPIALYSDKSLGAMKYKTLAEEFLSHHGVPVSTVTKSETPRREGLQQEQVNHITY